MLILNRTEIRGSEGTIGILCKGGEVIMKESVIKDHGGSGILMTGNKTTNLVIKNSSILSCHDGIVLNGPFSGVVDNNIIIGSFSTGIILKGGNRSSILNNELREC